MHSSKLEVHLQGEVPKVEVKDYNGFFTVEITFDKCTVQMFVDNGQELTNLKNNLLWAFEKPLNHK
ncbi:MAG: hypothetical protein IMF19_16780 [Proteobacteria bacterium]|nr:hypothetical protein [Pseudomonadota bacterium]